MAEPSTISLTGCLPEPLLSYLKGLGVLRLIGEQRDPGVRGCWQDNVFHLQSRLSLDELVAFFLDEYRPTPVVSPWNGGSGFYPKDAKEALQAIRASHTPRLAPYRETILAAQRALGDAAREKPAAKEKQALRRRLRSLLPDEALPWLDAAFMDTGERQVFGPILGTGGNDGRLDFSQNFMQRVVDVVLAADRRRVERLLRLALLGSGEGQLLSASVGQFDGGGAGGPNALPGFEGNSLVNPWDFVLAIEGALLFSGTVARRLNSNRDLRAAFPFATRPSAAGWSTLADTDTSVARAEAWLPLWPRPATLPEVRYLLAEGRAEVSGRPARSGVDFARAIATLGVDRGVGAFQRYGFLQRSGRAYIAVPLGQVAVRAQEEAQLLNQMDEWLDRLRQAVSGDQAPPRFRRALRRLEEAIFASCQFGGPRRLQDVLAAVGAAERELAAASSLHDAIPPLNHLRPSWLRAADDGSPEYRIAAALASIDGGGVPIRRQLEPVVEERGRWRWSTRSLGVVWGGGDMVRNLGAVLERRQLERRRRDRGRAGGSDDLATAGPAPELRARLAVPLGDVQRFLVGRLDDQRIADLLWALATLRWDESTTTDLPRWPSIDAPDLCRAYALLKLLYLPTALNSDQGEPLPVRSEPAVLPRLRAGDLAGAVDLAYRRLRAGGLVPRGGTGPDGRQPPDFVCSPTVQARLAGALLIPVWQSDFLTRLVLQPREDVTVVAP